MSKEMRGKTDDEKGELSRRCAKLITNACPQRNRQALHGKLWEARRGGETRTAQKQGSHC